MKKKILFAIAALMIAAAATFHLQNVTFGESESYATLESIAVMAEAQNESVNCPSGHCSSWTCSACCHGHNLPSCSIFRCRCVSTFL